MLIMSSNYRVTQPVTRILKDTKPTKQENMEQKNHSSTAGNKKRPHKKKKKERNKKTTVKQEVTLHRKTQPKPLGKSTKLYKPYKLNSKSHFLFITAATIFSPNYFSFLFSSTNDGNCRVHKKDSQR